MSDEQPIQHNGIFKMRCLPPPPKSDISFLPARSVWCRGTQSVHVVPARFRRDAQRLHDDSSHSTKHIPLAQFLGDDRTQARERHGPARFW